LIQLCFSFIGILLIWISFPSLPRAIAQALPDQETKLIQCVRLAYAKVQSEEGSKNPDYIRRRLETANALCANENPSKAAIIGQVNADLAQAARQYLDGSLNGKDYLMIVNERTGKYAKLLNDQTWATAYAAGDQDQDLIPNQFDKCSDSPSLRPTNQSGCPLKCSQSSTDPACRLPAPSSADDAIVKRIVLSSKLMLNPACDNAPTPTQPEQLLWGRGNGGYNLVVTKINNQPTKCEVFYEIDFRFDQPGLSTDPKVKYASVLFQNSEDLTPNDPRRAIFNIPATGSLPGQRLTAQYGLGKYLRMQWRVRAVNGSQKLSKWSASRIQKPNSSGVRVGS